MAKNKKPLNEGAVVVRRLKPNPNVKVGKIGEVTTAGGHRQTRLASMSNTILGQGGNFYSPELSTDFLELPQSRDEKWNYFRHFYRSNGFVHGAINFHVEMPMSKVRFTPAKAKNKTLAKAATRFCEKWAERVGLQKRLMEILHELNLLGECFIFAEDSTPPMPQEVTHREVVFVSDEADIVEKRWEPRDDAREREIQWLKRNYRGFSALRILPPEQMVIETYSFSSKKRVELIPDSATKNLVMQADSGDLVSQDIMASMPPEIVEAIREGVNVLLGTDPYSGSFVGHLSRNRCAYEPRGLSLLEPLLMSLVYRDKLRQAQTSIASRHMTPYRIVTAENLNDEQVDALREQVDLALMDPDFSIVANYNINWDERGADGRLLNLDGEYEITNKEMYAGTTLTEGLLTGESLYSGDRIRLETINRQFMLVRQVLQEYVDSELLAPMCYRMGFVEEDEDGNLETIHPRLSFTRLNIRDNNETFDILFNLYQKGSLPVDVIYEHLNLDTDEVNEKLKRDLFTIADSVYNDLVRAIYSRAGDMLVEHSDVVAKIASRMGVDYNKVESDANSRF